MKEKSLPLILFKKNKKISKNLLTIKKVCSIIDKLTARGWHWSLKIEQQEIS